MLDWHANARYMGRFECVGFIHVSHSGGATIRRHGRPYAYHSCGVRAGGGGDWRTAETESESGKTPERADTSRAQINLLYTRELYSVVTTCYVYYA